MATFKEENCKDTSKNNTKAHWIDHKDEHQCSKCGLVVIADVYDGEWGVVGNI